MLNEEVAKYRELSGDTNPNTPISRIGGYLDGYDKALEQEPILGKIRAKIAEKIVIRPALNHSRTERDRNDAFLEVLDIIDKYMAESEDK